VLMSCGYTTQRANNTEQTDCINVQRHYVDIRSLNFQSQKNEKKTILAICT